MFPVTNFRINKTSRTTFLLTVLDDALSNVNNQVAKLSQVGINDFNCVLSDFYHKELFDNTGKVKEKIKPLGLTGEETDWLDGMFAKIIQELGYKLEAIDFNTYKLSF